MKSQEHQKEVRVVAVGFLLVILVGVYFYGRTWWQGEKQSESEYNTLVKDGKEVTYPTITAESLQKMLGTPGEKFTIVDVRPREAYALSHIPNSLSYPDSTLTTVNLPSNNKIIVIGSEADEELNNGLSKFLSDKGFNFAFLEGGFTNWQNNNQQVVNTGDQSSFVDQSKIDYISPEALKIAFQTGAKYFVLDVQPPENFRRKHLQDAKNIPLGELENRIAELPKGQRIIVYGGSETESFRAGVILFDLSIFGVQVVTGDQVLNSGLFTEGQ